MKICCFDEWWVCSPKPRQDNNLQARTYYMFMVRGTLSIYRQFITMSQYSFHWRIHPIWTACVCMFGSFMFDFSSDYHAKIKISSYDLMRFKSFFCVKLQRQGLLPVKIQYIAPHLYTLYTSTLHTCGVYGS